MSNRITIIGTGYVGLVTGTCLADFGLDVICIDKDHEKISNLLEGIVPIYEPSLDILIKKNMEQGRLHFSTDLRYGVENSEVIFIAVGTPPQEDGSADLQMVEAVARDISKYMNGYKVIVNKSTVPVGTGQRVKQIINQYKKSEVEFDIVSNPEFLREGAAIKDFMHPDRVVIGSESEQAIEIMKDVYRVLYLNEVPFVVTNIETAELIKYASNAFLAMKISFINEVANLCQKVGANVTDVAIGMGKDGRIGSKFLHPGPGYGGSCFPKDTLALTKIAREAGAPVTLVETTIQVNQKQKYLMVEKIKNIMGNISGKTIAVLGLAFKPETDDMRDAPALTVLPELLKAGASIRAYDPKAMEEARWRLNKYPNLILCNNEYETIQGANAVVILTEWNQFRSLNMQRVKDLLVEPYFFDLRNIYEPSKLIEMGFTYTSVGR